MCSPLRLNGANRIRSTPVCLASCSQEAVVSLFSGPEPSLTSTPTCRSRRRATKAMTLLLGASTHCASSIAISTGKSDGQACENRKECRPDDPMVAWATPVAGPQSIHCNTLNLRQAAHCCAVDIADQIGDNCISRHRPVLTCPSRQDPKPTLPRLLNRRRPQHGLADAGVALDHERRRALSRRRQELNDFSQFGRPADESLPRHYVAPQT